MPHDEITDQLTVAQGFSMLAWAEEHNGLVAVRREGRGYIGQELDRRIGANKMT